MGGTRTRSAKICPIWTLLKRDLGELSSAFCLLEKIGQTLKRGMSQIVQRREECGWVDGWGGEKKKEFWNFDFENGLLKFVCVSEFYGISLFS